MAKKQQPSDSQPSLFDTSGYMQTHPDAIDVTSDPPFLSEREARAIAARVEEGEGFLVRGGTFVPLSQNSDRDRTAPEHTPLPDIKEEVLEPSSPQVIETSSGADAPPLAPELSSRPWLETYPKKDNHYLLLCWREAGRRRSLHIKGGNINSPIVKGRRAAIERAIALGKTLEEIKQIACTT